MMDFLGLVWVASLLGGDMPTVAVSSLFNDNPEADPKLPIVRRGVAAREAPSAIFPDPQRQLQLLYASQSSLLAATTVAPDRALSASLPTDVLMQLPPRYPTAVVSAMGWMPTAWLSGKSLDEAGDDQTTPFQKTSATTSDSLAEIVSQLPSLSPDLVEWETWKSVAKVQVTSQMGVYSHPEVDELPPMNCLPLPAKTSPVAASAILDQGQQFQIRVDGHVVGEVRQRRTAEHIAEKIRQLLQASDWHPDDIKPLIGHAYAAGRVNHDILFVADASMAMESNESYANIAIRWVNNLRVVLGGEALDVADISDGSRRVNRNPPDLSRHSLLVWPCLPWQTNGNRRNFQPTCPHSGPSLLALWHPIESAKLAERPHSGHPHQ
ncbi:hypothetical protein XM38_006620 [Halomicronema hongdechloris C2206]|uniref:Uncharacterized protein n=1 Tax=Halomicronema hongdechloris C2206 TaxID=1641165 RepID=A0A1Z3HHJ1_9CYAN|nr:hypothetical protein XM38_006620 [Halomicronema hongdechloris C2206]